TDGDRRETLDELSVNPAHPNYFVDAINGPAKASYLDLGRQGHSLLVVAGQVFGAARQSRFQTVDASGAFSGGGDGMPFASATLADSSAVPVPSVVVPSLIGGRAGAGLAVTAAAFTGQLSLAVPPETGGAVDVLVVDDIRGWTTGDTV